MKRNHQKEWQTLELDLSSILAESLELALIMVDVETVTSTDLYRWNRLQARMVMMARRVGILPPIKHLRRSRIRAEVAQKRKARTGSVWR